jgi:hypothetical protein
MPAVPSLLGLFDAAIDDYAEREIAKREYFWNRPHSAGWPDESFYNLQ